jgi:hypothetical protein
MHSGPSDASFASSTSTSSSSLSISSFIKHTKHSSTSSTSSNSSSSLKKRSNKRLNKYLTAQDLDLKLRQLFYKYAGKKTIHLQEHLNNSNSNSSKTGTATKANPLVETDKNDVGTIDNNCNYSENSSDKPKRRINASFNKIKKAFSGNDTKKEKLTTIQRTRIIEILLLDPQQRLMLHLASLSSSSCKPIEMEALIDFFKQHPRILNQLLQTVIMIEVEQSRNDTSLFRSNSVGVKFLSAFALSVGRAYLLDILSSAIEKVLVVDRSLEVNPARMQKQTQIKAKKILEEDEGNIAALQKLMDVDMSVDTVEKNRKELLTLVDNHFLASIFEDKLGMPHVLRRTYTFLRECVRQRYPNSANMALGGFLFLRFFCPVIVAPHLLFKQKVNTVGSQANKIILETAKSSNSFSRFTSGDNDKTRDNFIRSIPKLPGQLTSIQQRNLTLIAKILQKIASDSDVFKEKYMTFCNPCIIKRREEAYNWYNELCYDGIGNMHSDVQGRSRSSDINILADVDDDEKNLGEARIGSKNIKNTVEYTNEEANNSDDDDDEIIIEDFNSLNTIIGLLGRNSEALMNQFDKSVARGSIIDIARETSDGIDTGNDGDNNHSCVVM